MIRAIILIQLASLILACGNSKKATQVSEPASAVVKPSVVIPPDSLFLSFERTQCFGECPWYRITIDSKGNCLYEGFKWVDRTGKHKAVVPMEILTDIRSRAEAIGFFNMKDNYDGPVSDLPSTIIIMSTGEEPKQVIDRFQAPEELRNFETYLDRILLNLEWQTL